VGWRGDGTVPTVSAIPAELSDRQVSWRGVADKHGPLGGTAGVRDLLTSLLGDKVPTRGTLEPDQPWLGFDLEDTVVSGRDTAMGVEVLGAAGDPGSSATVTLGSPAGTPVAPPLPLTFEGGRWTARLPDLPPGSYMAEVTVTDAWHGTSVYGRAPFVVIRDDGDWAATDETGEATE
jgi:hypothetical protein